jgi:hypothetical protein
MDLPEDLHGGDVLPWDRAPVGRIVGPEEGGTMNIKRGKRPEAVEVHLEELDAHSWLKAVPDTLTEPYGAGQYRFVVVAAPGADHCLKDHLTASLSFPALRLQDPDRASEPDAWLDVAQRRLADLDSELVRAGWHRRPARGRFWWSLVYDAASEQDDTGEGPTVEEVA